MKKVWLFLLLFMPSITFAQEDIRCKDIDDDKNAQKLYNWLIDWGYRSREGRYKTDSFEKAVKTFINDTYRSAAVGLRYNEVLRGDPDPQIVAHTNKQLDKIKKAFPYSTFKSELQICCTEQQTMPKDECLQTMIMGMEYHVSTKPIPDYFTIPEEFKEERIVHNPSNRSIYPKCPEHSTHEPCILYVKNTSDKDQIAESFFDEVARKSGRQPFMIRIENQHYAKTIIPKGSIAEIKIPPLR